MTPTILLIQPSTNPNTRTYTDYETVTKCLEGICKIYEEFLYQKNSNVPAIIYDLSQLFEFLDQLFDVSCLIYQESTNTYAPCNKDWIKENIYILLRKAADSPAISLGE